MEYPSVHWSTAMNDRIENLWGSFDLISAELVKAKRQFREGNACEDDLTWLRVELLTIRQELCQLGQHAVDPEAAED
jgi:hypothetical protein